MKIVDLKCARHRRPSRNPHPHRRGDRRNGAGGVLQALPQAPRPLLPRPRIGHGPDRRRARHARHPPARRFQALGQRRQRHRDGALGHRRQGRRDSRVQAARGKDPRPGASLPDRLAGAGNRVPARELRRRRPRRQGAAAGVHPVQDGGLLPQQHARGRPPLLLRGGLRRPLARQPRPADGTRPEARDRLRRGDEAGAGGRGRPRPRLRSRNDRPGLDTAGPGRGAAEPDVARGHDHRRLRPLRARRPLPGGDAQPPRRRSTPGSRSTCGSISRSCSKSRR